MIMFDDARGRQVSISTNGDVIVILTPDSPSVLSFSKDQVKQLIPVLRSFVLSGRLVDDREQA